MVAESAATVGSCAVTSRRFPVLQGRIAGGLHWLETGNNSCQVERVSPAAVQANICKTRPGGDEDATCKAGREEVSVTAGTRERREANIQDHKRENLSDAE